MNTKILRRMTLLENIFTLSVAMLPLKGLVLNVLEVFEDLK